MKDRLSKAIQAWFMARRRLVIHEGKTDNELTILALKELLLEKVGINALPVEPPPEESESNSTVENAVKLFKGMLHSRPWSGRSEEESPPSIR